MVIVATVLLKMLVYLVVCRAMRVMCHNKCKVTLILCHMKVLLPVEHKMLCL